MLLLVQQGPEWLELARYCEREAQRWQQKTPQLRTVSSRTDESTNFRIALRTMFHLCV